MIKVLQVVGTMNRGGAEVMLMHILRNKPDYIHFDFLVNNPPEDLEREGVFDDEIRSRGCQIRHIGSQLRLGPVRYIKEFTKVCEELQPDVVHAHLNAKCGIIALAAHRAGCKRIISHCHANIRFRGSFISIILGELELAFQKRLIAKYATDWWGCSSDANRRLYLPRVRRKSVVINNAIELTDYQIVNPVDVSGLRTSYNLPDSTIILGNVGRIVPHKNIAFIVEVMDELRKRGKDVAFVVAGRDDSPYYTAKLRDRANEIEIPKDRILFLGERSDIPVVMHTFDVYVGPALREGFGLVAIEAQAAAVPCVLYKGYPKGSDMGVGLCTILDDLNPMLWADAIIAATNRLPISKDIVYQSITELGFDAKENSRRVCLLYADNN